MIILSQDKEPLMYTRALLSLFLVFHLASSGHAQEGLVYPIDVAVGPDDSVYVADRKLPGIWKIVDGKPEVVFKGSQSFRTPLNAIRCLVVDEAGTLFAGDSATREVYSLGPDHSPLPLTAGSIGIAADLLVDGENIIVSDLETQRLWTVPKTGGKPQELCVLAGVRGLAHDATGRLICVTTLADPVRRVAAQGQLETILAGRPFSLPHHCAIVKNDIFVADNYAGTIWKVALTQDAKPEAFAKGAPLQKPVGLCRYKQGFLVADPHAKQIFVIDEQGQVAPLIR